jgi:hypothetical protein
MVVLAALMIELPQHEIRKRSGLGALAGSGMTECKTHWIGSIK